MMQLLKPALFVSATAIGVAVWFAGNRATDSPPTGAMSTQSSALNVTTVDKQFPHPNTAPTSASNAQRQTLFDSLPELRRLSPEDRAKLLNKRFRELSDTVFAPLESGATTPALALADFISRGRGGDNKAALAANVLVDRCAQWIFSRDYDGGQNLLPTQRSVADKCREIGANQIKDAGYLLNERVAARDADAAWIMYQRAALVAEPFLINVAMHDPIFLASQQQAGRDAFQLLEQTGSEHVLRGIALAYMDQHLLPPQPTLKAAYSLAAHAVMLNNGLANDAGQDYDQLTAGRIAKLNATERAAAFATADQILARCCVGVRLNPGNK